MGGASVSQLFNAPYPDLMQRLINAVHVYMGAVCFCHSVGNYTIQNEWLLVSILYRHPHPISLNVKLLMCSARLVSPVKVLA